MQQVVPLGDQPATEPISQMQVASSVPPTVGQVSQALVASEALEQHRQELEVFLREWGLSLDSLVVDLLVDPTAAAAAARRLRKPEQGGGRVRLAPRSRARPAGAEAIISSAGHGAEAQLSELGDEGAGIPSTESSARVEPLMALAAATPEGEAPLKTTSGPDIDLDSRPPTAMGSLMATSAPRVVGGNVGPDIDLDPRSTTLDAKMKKRSTTTGVEDQDSYFQADRDDARILGLGNSGNSLARSCLEKFDLLFMEPTTPREGAFKCLSRVVASSGFEALSALAILANAIYIAYASNHEIMRVVHGGSVLPEEIDLSFTVWYAVELLLRVYVYGPRFYACEDWKWNLFDTILVLFSVQDLVGSAGQSNPSFLRVMRLARMMKLLRVIRLMRMFRELRLILNSILGCMKSMFWAMILIVNVSFIFGLCFLQATTDHLKEEGDSIDPTLRDDLLSFWGNVGLSMYSLYAAALGGLDWEEQADGLYGVGPTFWILYLLYIGFFFCVITNTLTSLFVEATMINAEKDKDQIIQAELDQKEMYVDRIKKLFMKIGGGKGESLGLDKFLMHLQDPEMIYFAATLGIEVVDLKQFFTILSMGGQQAVDVETFVVSCIKLKGTAKSMDLMDMKISLKRDISVLRKQVKEIRHLVDDIAQ